MRKGYSACYGSRSAPAKPDLSLPAVRAAVRVHPAASFGRRAARIHITASGGRRGWKHLAMGTPTRWIDPATAIGHRLAGDPGGQITPDAGKPPEKRSLAGARGLPFRRGELRWHRCQHHGERAYSQD